MRAVIRLFVVLLMLMVTGAATAQTTRWVADDLEVAVRSGPSLKHKILRFIESGTPMTVLAQDDESGYSQVRTPDGIEGWMLTEQLMDRRGARERLERAEARIESLQASQQQSRGEIEALQARIRELEAEKATLQSTLEGAQAELSELRRVAAEPIAVAQENETLSRALAAEQQKVERLGAEVRVLKDRSLKEWFLIGAGVSLGSLFLGLIIPRIRWRRRGWDEFR